MARPSKSSDPKISVPKTKTDVRDRPPFLVYADGMIAPARTTQSAFELADALAPDGPSAIYQKIR